MEETLIDVSVWATHTEWELLYAQVWQMDLMRVDSICIQHLDKRQEELQKQTDKSKSTNCAGDIKKENILH